MSIIPENKETEKITQIIDALYYEVIEKKEYFKHQLNQYTENVTKDNLSILKDITNNIDKMVKLEIIIKHVFYDDTFISKFFEQEDADKKITTMYTLSDDLVHTKPVAITFLGERKIVSSWRNVVHVICEELFTKHQDKVDELINEPFIKGITYNLDEFKDSRKVDTIIVNDKEVYIDFYALIVNQYVGLKKVIRFFEYSIDDVKLELTLTKNNRHKKKKLAGV